MHAETRDPACRIASRRRQKICARTRRATEMAPVQRSSPVHGASNIFLVVLAATVIEQAVGQSGNAY
jgi:hypothetical protein